MNPLTGARRGYNLQILILPILSVLVILVPIAVLHPIVLKYVGLQLLLNMPIPLSLATIGQMFAMAIGEIDFSMGNLVSLVTCTAGTVMSRSFGLGLAMLVGIIGIYMIIGAFLNLRKLSSIVVTIGVSFVWTGLAVTIQPTLGGSVPSLLQEAVSLSTPIVPFPVLFLVVLAVLGHLLLFRTSFGILVRGIGGNL